jgi:hypothetical protein
MLPPWYHQYHIVVIFCKMGAIAVCANILFGQKHVNKFALPCIACFFQRTLYHHLCYAKYY